MIPCRGLMLSSANLPEVDDFGTFAAALPFGQIGAKISSSCRYRPANLAKQMAGNQRTAEIVTKIGYRWTSASMAAAKIPALIGAPANAQSGPASSAP